MELTTKLNKQALYPLGSALLQTIAIVIPGSFLNQQSSNASFGLPAAILFLYLLINELVQMVNLRQFRKGKHLPFLLIIGKLIISMIFIAILTSSSTLWYGFIFLLYEAAQVLSYLPRWAYLDTSYYTLTSAFFKGIIFNVMLTLNLPFHFQFSIFTPFIFSFCLFLVGTSFTQGIHSAQGKSKKFMIQFAVSLLLTNAALIAITNPSSKAIFRIILIIICEILLYGFMLLRIRQAAQKELLMNALLVILNFLYYM